MKITFLGQSGFHIETQGKHLIIDPFITPNPKADTTAHPHIAPEQLPADYIYSPMAMPIIYLVATVSQKRA